MSTVTEIMWDIITVNDELHSELTRIMRQEYEPFLIDEKATTVNTFKLESYLREELAKWYEWLPERPIDMIGGEFAMEALRHFDLRHTPPLLFHKLPVAR